MAFPSFNCKNYHLLLEEPFLLQNMNSKMLKLLKVSQEFSWTCSTFLLNHLLVRTNKSGLIPMRCELYLHAVHPSWILPYHKFILSWRCANIIQSAIICNRSWRVNSDVRQNLVVLGSYCLVRFIRLCYQACFFAASFGIIVQLPTYYTANGESLGIDRCSMANTEQGR